jgi:hypothetical protein
LALVDNDNLIAGTMHFQIGKLHRWSLPRDGAKTVAKSHDTKPFKGGWTFDVGVCSLHKTQNNIALEERSCGT